MLWCCAICVRLIYLQVFRYGTFEQRAQHQQQRTEEVSARRGIIYDRAGRELATAVYKYSHGVIDEALPVEGKPVRLEADWALQDPADYVRTFQRAIPTVLRQSGVDPADAAVGSASCPCR